MYWVARLFSLRRKELNDLFTDSSLINVIDYFITNNVRTVSDITEAVLMKLLFYPNVDYIKFKATTDILFVEKNVSEIIENHNDEQEFDSINVKELDEDEIVKETLIQSGK